jgi:hypothetical protein
MRRRISVLSAVFGLVVASAALVAQAAAPLVFDVNNATDPSFKATGAGSCTSQGNDMDGEMTTCTTQLAVNTDPFALDGSVTENTTGLSGSFTGSTCTASSGSGTATRVISIPPAVGGVVQAAQTTPGPEQDSFIEDCSFQWTFTDSQNSTIVGTAHLINDASGDGSVFGTITSGTGAFAGDVGVLTIGNAATHATIEYSRFASRSQSDSGGGEPWKLVLRTGPAEVAIAYPYPGSTVTASTDQGLRVVSAAHASCIATAVSDARTVKLGAKVTGANGSALILPKITATLKPGRWAVSVACGTATIKKAITIS